MTDTHHTDLRPWSIEMSTKNGEMEHTATIRRGYSHGHETWHLSLLAPGEHEETYLGRWGSYIDACGAAISRVAAESTGDSEDTVTIRGLDERHTTLIEREPEKPWPPLYDWDIKNAGWWEASCRMLPEYCDGGPPQPGSVPPDGKLPVLDFKPAQAMLRYAIDRLRSSEEPLLGVLSDVIEDLDDLTHDPNLYAAQATDVLTKLTCITGPIRSQNVKHPNLADAVRALEAIAPLSELDKTWGEKPCPETSIKIAELRHNEDMDLLEPPYMHIYWQHGEFVVKDFGRSYDGFRWHPSLDDALEHAAQMMAIEQRQPYTSTVTFQATPAAEPCTVTVSPHAQQWKVEPGDNEDTTVVDSIEDAWLIAVATSRYGIHSQDKPMPTKLRRWLREINRHLDQVRSNLTRVPSRTDFNQPAAIEHLQAIETLVQQVEAPFTTPHRIP